MVTSREFHIRFNIDFPEEKSVSLSHRTMTLTNSSIYFLCCKSGVISFSMGASLRISWKVASKSTTAFSVRLLSSGVQFLSIFIIFLLIRDDVHSPDINTSKKIAFCDAMCEDSDTAAQDFMSKVTSDFSSRKKYGENSVRSPQRLTGQRRCHCGARASEQDVDEIGGWTVLRFGQQMLQASTKRAEEVIQCSSLTGKLQCSR